MRMAFFLKKLFVTAESIPPAAPKSGHSRAPAAHEKSEANTSPQAAPAAVCSHVSLSLKAIAAALPPEIRAALREEPSGQARVEIPREKIDRQLATGAVRITLGELQALAPADFLAGVDADAATLVRMPMVEIVSQIQPVRPAGQKEAVVPEDVGAVFSRAGSAAAAVPAAQKGAWHSSPRPAPTPECVSVAFAKVAGGFSKTALGELARHAAFSRATLRLPLAELEPAVARGRIVFDWKQLQQWLSEPLAVSIGAETMVELPLPVIVPLFLAAKKPASRAAEAAPEIAAEIPDIFSKAAGRRKVEDIAAPTADAGGALDISEEDLEMPVTVEKETAAPARRLVPAATAAPIATAPDDSPAAPLPPHQAAAHGHHATPEQIVARACALPNVEGAFVATHDGLFVAGHTPGMNERTMAAFVPNIFSQVRAYALVARLGQPESVCITLPDRAVHILRCGKLFFGALGAAPLPEAGLREIAAQFHQSE